MRKTTLVVMIAALCILGIMTMGAAVAGANPNMISGKVLETMDSGGYTYLHIDTGNGKVWAAIPKVKVKKGDKVTLQPGMPMANFTSKGLGRTFEVIYFCGGLAR